MEVVSVRETGLGDVYFGAMKSGQGKKNDTWIP